MPTSISELHALYPYDTTERGWNSSVPFDIAVQYADEIQHQEDPLAYLDDLHDTDIHKAIAINDALLFLPPKIVLQELGEDVAVWTSVNTVIQGKNDAINAVLESDAGYNLQDLETARLWEWRHGYSRTAQRVSAQYRLMQMMRSGLLEQVDLAEIIATGSRDDVTLSEKRIKDYELKPIEIGNLNIYYCGGRVKDWSGEVSDNLAYGMWLDAPVGYSLMYKGLPNAMGGIALNGNNELMLYQLQGVRGQRIDHSQSIYSGKRYTEYVPSRGLAPLDWQKVMNGVLEQLAVRLKMDSTAIQSGHNNIWTQERMTGEADSHLALEKATKAYDIPARRLGYRKIPADRKDNWHKPLAA